MIQQHNIVMSKRRYPRGLRIFECRDCDYAFMAEVFANDVPDLMSRVPVNVGDGRATHRLFYRPDVEMGLSVGATAADMPTGSPGCDC